jgi:hypothetical protein
MVKPCAGRRISFVKQFRTIRFQCRPKRSGRSVADTFAKHPTGCCAERKHIPEKRSGNGSGRGPDAAAPHYSAAPVDSRPNQGKRRALSGVRRLGGGFRRFVQLKRVVASHGSTI